MNIKTHIKDLRGLIVADAQWAERFSTPKTRSVINRLFDCGISDYESMTDRQFALAIVAANGNALCTVPNAIWQEIEEEATAMLKLQAVAGTFPKHKVDSPCFRYPLPVNEENWLTGWQPLCLVLAAGADKVEFIGGLENGERSDWFMCSRDGDVLPQMKEGYFSFDFSNWLIGFDGFDWLARVIIDIYSGTVSIDGKVETKVSFQSNFSIYNHTGLVVDDIIKEAAKYDHGIVNVSMKAP